MPARTAWTSPQPTQRSHRCWQAKHHFLLYFLWLPFRVLRALRRWPRIPVPARDLVGEHQRRFTLDVAATWGLVVSAFLAIVATATQTGGTTSGGATAWSVALGIGAMVGIAVSLSRMIPRVFRLGWPTRRRPTPRRTSPWDQTVRFQRAGSDGGDGHTERAGGEA